MIECRHPDCNAIQVTDGKQYSHTIEKNCEKMISCDFQDVCSTNQNNDTYFCDRHAEIDLFEYEENQKTGKPLYICLLCRNYRIKLAELEKLSYFKDKDIDLVMQQTNCSKSKAVESLVHHQGDIVMAIMSLQM